MRSVVASGIGFVTCIGNGKAQVAENLRSMRHGLSLYAPFDKPDCPVKVVGSVKGFAVDSLDQEDWTLPPDMPPLRLEQLRSLPPHGAYALYAAAQAIQDAGLSMDEVSDPRTGMYTASSGSSTMLFHHLDRMHKVGARRGHPLGVVSSIAGTLNFNLVSYFKILGSSTGFVSACASSGHALGAAFDEVALGRQDRMIVIGAEDCNADTILPFAALRALSTSTDPDTASRPFDRGRDGFVGTGGAVAMLIEDEESARKRGAPIYARLKGWGQASDGHHSMMPHPRGEGLVRAMNNALAASGMTAGNIDYLNAHATSTQAGDTAELLAMKAVFGTGATPAISSTKALTGHGLSLSSIMESAFCVMALKEAWMPGSAHISAPDKDCEGLNILRETREGAYSCAMSNSSGFGGANVSIIFERV
ncbi:MAG: beta-ketoacyl-[acyl-carrier-protein] synthase family protein [Opitutales bacterium]|nr:beta-ketoacyl-[acyl-carrier-protein] synthase family protein [Opitutales bacterium]